MIDESLQKSLDVEIAKRDYDENISDAAKRIEYQVQFASSLLRNLQLVNGGAILSLLTFLGNTQSLSEKTAMENAFICFGLGLVFSLAAYLGAFFSQSAYYHASLTAAWNYLDQAHGRAGDRSTERPYFWGTLSEWSGVAFALASLGMFCLGSWLALGGLFGR